MVGRRAACRGHRGGDGVQAPRIARAPLATAAASVAVAAALTCWLALEAETTVGWLLLGVGGLGVVALAIALLFRWPAPIPAGLFLLGAVYALFLTLEDVPVDNRAPLAAAALLVTAELAYWSLELRTTVTDERGAAARRLAWTMVLAVGGLVLAAVTLALVDLVSGDGLWIEALGALAAIAALALLLASARRSASSE